MRVDQAIEDEDPPSPTLEPYLKSSRPLEQGEVLEPDQSVYEILHRMNVQWPCLSFDVLKVGSFSLCSPAREGKEEEDRT
jgi:ribosome assembly protein RRB1